MRKRLMLMTMMTAAVAGSVGCGDQQGSKLAVGDPSPGESLSFSDDHAPFEGELPDRPRLSFRSEWQQLHGGSFGLELKLGWSGLGFEVAVAQQVRTVSAALFDVAKTASAPDSRIFNDDRGHFEIREGESVTGRCEYAMAAQLRLGEEAAVMVAGVKVEHEYENAKLLEVTVADRFFAVEADKTLADYEQVCRDGFKAFESSMRQDLTAALKSKVVIHKVGDSRIDALRSALVGERVGFTTDGGTWELEPVKYTTEGEAIVVAGRLSQLGRFGGRSYDFRHEFKPGSGSDRLKLNKMTIAPRGVDKADQTAMELSVYFAQNVARRATSDGMFSVDTSLLR
ncbi:MAG: hypothetical protein FJ146_19440 [Deltaproteobacteria bacterium]|nr:hypothetical protein [Deltaproteobacteria bacterium]